jgi:hypothetical protein
MERLVEADGTRAEADGTRAEADGTRAEADTALLFKRGRKSRATESGFLEDMDRVLSDADGRYAERQPPGRSTSTPPMYGRSAFGKVTLPSAFW